ncbi:hypothetical protein [Alsobacter soli]|uniref:hypothetical protein n=1 Tax=Alsobacter soli TaxID=2109933 RepID=UPI0011B28594|nr:hypothetical protein [Alsobacter soli]
MSAALLDKGLRAGQIVMERFDYGTARDPVSRTVARRFWLVLGCVAVGTAIFAVRIAITDA